GFHLLSGLSTCIAGTEARAVTRRRAGNAGAQPRAGGAQGEEAARRTGEALRRTRRRDAPACLDRSVISIVHTRCNTTQKRRTNDKAPFPAGTASCPPPATLARTNKVSLLGFITD
uniref:Uncharacterized protein n=1 Tax=Oryza meridionalis TaxID=40149 RepID=A0A0E0DVX8_9ORYZ